MGVNPENSRPRGRPSEGAREALVQAMRELLIDHDYGEIPTELILERAGVSRGAMYHHFPGKLDLFRAAWQASEQDALAAIAADVGIPGETDRPFDQLLAGARAYLRAAATNRELQRIGLRQSRAVLGWEGWREGAAELGIGLMRAGVQAVADAGEIDSSDLDATTHLILAALIEAALLIASDPDPNAALKRVEPDAIRIVEGLRVPTRI